MRKKVPVIMQMEAIECGAASLCMILAYWGKFVSLEEMRESCGISRDGSRASYLVKAGRGYGLKADGYRYEIEDLKTKASLPCIVHWEFNHFIVLEGFKGNKVYVADPGRGAYSMSMEDFDRGYTGIALCFEPGENFEKGGKAKSLLSILLSRLKGAGSVYMVLSFATLLVSLLGLVTPAFSRYFMDVLLPSGTFEQAQVFFAAMAACSILTFMASCLQAFLSLRFAGKTAAASSAEFVWHLLRLPIKFFSQRSSGDLHMRLMSNEMTEQLLMETFAPLLINALFLIVYLVIMIRYSLLLSLIALTSMALSMISSRLIAKLNVNISRAQVRDQAKLAGSTVVGLSAIESIKASGFERNFFERWSGYQASVTNSSLRAARLNALFGFIPLLLDSGTYLLILFVGASLCMQGNFSVGMLMAFMGIMSSFNGPASVLSSTAGQVEMMRTNIERVEDVMNYPVDTQSQAKAEKLSKLKGNVELKDISFGYSHLAPALIEHFSMTLEPGKKVAIVGASGSGKSTITKLLSGLYKPWTGEILFDGCPIQDIDPRILRSSLAVVDQDIQLFDDTVRNNIKMWDRSIEDFEMILAARDAQIHDSIMQRPGAYNSTLREGGKDFSGGERQRLEIARVLAQDPTIIVMDEATSALDAQTELDVVKAITMRGISCIIVAHRLSTVRDADEIIVLDKGHVVERGTHDELMAKQGAYAALISMD